MATMNEFLENAFKEDKVVNTNEDEKFDKALDAKHDKFLDDVGDKVQDMLSSLGYINKSLNSLTKGEKHMMLGDVKNVQNFSTKANSLIGSLMKKVDLS